MDKGALDRPVGEMTVGEFRELVRDVLTEAEKRVAEAAPRPPDVPAGERVVGELTVDEMRALLREVLEEERRRDYYIDDEGTLVFFSEEAYAEYVDKQKGKLPSEVNAYFFDEQGYKCFYSDWVPTPEKARELEEARREIAEGKVHRLEDVIKELGLEVGNV